MKIAEMSATLVDSMGTDLNVVNSARVSFAKESEFDLVWGCNEFALPEQQEVLKESDVKLIRYLAKHKHITPFMHCFATFRMKAPLFVARQLVKHQIGLSWNEESRRYIDDEVEVWLPKFWRSRAENVKQGSSLREVSPNTYGSGVCVQCGADVPRKSAGPRGKWCSEKCRATYRRDVDPDFRLHSLKYNAEKRGQLFTLERGDIEWVMKCPILGIELDYSSTTSTNDNAPSVDRIDSSKGYIKENVWVISNKANRMKNDATNSELIEFARAILLKFNGQVVPKNGEVYAQCEHMVNHYYHLLGEGVAPEQARMVLPLNTMTNWIWSGSLAAWARVANLRLDPHAQLECQEIVTHIDEACSQIWPVSWEALRGVG